MSGPGALPEPVVLGSWHQRAQHICRLNTVCPPEESHERDTVTPTQLYTRAQVEQVQAEAYAAGQAEVTSAAEDYRAAWRTASSNCDRFRDVVCEVTGFDRENPGDDVVLAALRSQHGKTGPEPTRWRDFLTGTEAEIAAHGGTVGADLVEHRPDAAR